MKSWNYLWIVALLLCCVGTANTQTRPPLSKNEPSASSTHLIEVTRDYKANSENLLQLQEDEIKKATQKLEQLRHTFGLSYSLNLGHLSVINGTFSPEASDYAQLKYR
jgi:TolA-binding protein